MALTKASFQMLKGKVVTPEDFGAVGDGVTDDSAAMALACTYCAETGATLWMSPVVYHNAQLEVHGTFTVHGNGATVRKVGVGQTIIAGTGSGTSAVPTPWPSDATYEPTYPATTMYSLSVAPSKGDTSITLTDATGITAGMYLFLAGNPTSSSSPSNFIPADFEFVQVTSVAGNVVTLEQPLQSAYLTTQSGVFYTPGLAVHCTVNDVNINGTSEAYLLTVRSSFGCTLNNILFSGKNNPGASTFSDNLVLNDITIEGNDAGGLSTGRGIVCATFNNIHNKNYVNVSGFSAFFVEESFYKIMVNNLLSTGILAGGNVATASSQRPRTLTFNNCTINSNAYGATTYGAFQFGTMQGVDIIANDCVFQGSVVTPNSGVYPGITGDAMAWVSSNQAGDLVTFKNCKFISTNSGNTWPSAISGLQGDVRFDPLCDFVTCTPPSEIVPISGVGSWTPTVFGATSAGTTTYTAQNGSYSREGRLVTVSFEVSWSAASGTGNMKIGGLPFLAGSGNFGIEAVFTGSVAIANAIGFKVTSSSTEAYGYATITASGSLVGKLSYTI